jgi:glutaredoxin
MPAEKEAIGKKATLHRMVTPEHVCPYGLKAKELLESSGFKVDDRQLMSRDATDAFKKEHGVATTPLVFIDGEKIGGYDELKKRLAP